jgi:hypothetical protein
VLGCLLTSVRVPSPRLLRRPSRILGIGLEERRLRFADDFTRGTDVGVESSQGWPIGK